MSWSTSRSRKNIFGALVSFQGLRIARSGFSTSCAELKHCLWPYALYLLHSEARWSFQNVWLRLNTHHLLCPLSTRPVCRVQDSHLGCIFRRTKLWRTDRLSSLLWNISSSLKPLVLKGGWRPNLFVLLDLATSPAARKKHPQGNPALGAPMPTCCRNPHQKTASRSITSHLRGGMFAPIFSPTAAPQPDQAGLWGEMQDKRLVLDPPSHRQIRFVYISWRLFLNSFPPLFKQTTSSDNCVEARAKFCTGPDPKSLFGHGISPSFSAVWLSRPYTHVALGPHLWSDPTPHISAISCSPLLFLRHYVILRQLPAQGKEKEARSLALSTRNFTPIPWQKQMLFPKALSGTLFSKSGESQKTFRYLWRFYSLLFRAGQEQLSKASPNATGLLVYASCHHVGVSPGEDTDSEWGLAP